MQLTLIERLIQLGKYLNLNLLLNRIKTFDFKVRKIVANKKKKWEA